VAYRPDPDRPIPHGTYRGWQQCRLREQGTCTACKEAARQYAANHRKTNPESYRREKRQQKARDLAMREVSRRHHAEYRALAEKYEVALANGWNPSSS